MNQDRFKFRAWDTKHKEMIYEENSFNWFSKLLIDQGDIFAVLLYSSGKCDYDAIDGILMQCTGLKDRNGTPIFEGDILEGHPDGLEVIKWNESDGSWDYDFSDDGVVGIWELEKQILLVLGNIYENPDLLIK